MQPYALAITQLDELRKELDTARTALRSFQSKANMVAPTAGGPDKETAQYMAIGSELSTARAGLTALQSRLSSGSTDLSNDPSDPDLQILSGLKEKLSTAESEWPPPRAPLALTTRRCWPNRLIWRRFASR